MQQTESIRNAHAEADEAPPATTPPLQQPAAVSGRAINLGIMLAAAAVLVALTVAAL